MSELAVSVIVPTLGRPASLERALRSVLSQTRRDGCELVVVDNDPARSAEAVVSRLEPEAPFPVRYVLAPEPGVSNARNAGVAAAAGALIAFLDDDESAPPHWLDALMAVNQRFGAQVVFGPVRGDLPAEVVEDREFLTRFFSRSGPAESGISTEVHGCGNCLIERAALPDPRTPFSPARNRIGGEDDLLFGEMKLAGARFAWAADAWVLEHVPPERANLRYTLQRAFAYGQGPSSSSAALGPRGWPMVPVWMSVGAVQAIAFGLSALLSTFMRRDVAVPLNRAVQGLGKLLWFPPFKLAFYGRLPSAPRSTG